MPQSSGPSSGQRPDNGSACSPEPRYRPSYERWYARPDGEHALAAQHLLLRRMISGWPRRGHNLLELCSGSGHFLESFWEAGFDVTGQEHDQGLVRQSRRRLGNRVSITLNRPERLPFDDQSFDYVACLNGLEFAENPEELIKECFRLASLGLLVAFPSSLSLRGLGLFLSGLSGRTGRRALEGDRRRVGGAADSAAQEATNDDPDVCAEDPILTYGAFRRFSPFRIMSLARKYSPPARVSWGSVLGGPAWSWNAGSLCGKLSMISLPFPLGACAMLRLDFAPAYTGTLLPLRAGSEKQAAKTALAKEGLAKGGLADNGLRDGGLRGRG